MSLNYESKFVSHSGTCPWKHTMSIASQRWQICNHTHTNCHLSHYLLLDCSDHILCKIVKKKKKFNEIGDSLSAGVHDVIDARQPVFTLVGQLKSQRGRHNGERSLSGSVRC